MTIYILFTVPAPDGKMDLTLKNVTAIDKNEERISFRFEGGRERFFECKNVRVEKVESV